MAKVLVIPDVHLKAGMFDRADKILASGQADFAVQLGDLVDDWDMQFAVAYYEATIKRAIQFHRKRPNTLWCMGNHDFGYYHPDYGRRETGHSKLMEQQMERWLKRFEKVGIKQQVVHVVDNTIFCHGAIIQDWVERQAQLVDCADPIDLGTMCKLANAAAPEELWLQNSPLWARPQENYNSVTGAPIGSPPKLYAQGVYWQVVGHTPMRRVVEQDGLLSTDVFSTYPDGRSYGIERFAVVDTAHKTWKYAEEVGMKI